MIKQTYLYLLLSVLIMGCSFGSKKEEKATIPEPATIPRYVEYEVETINEYLGPCANDSTSKKCLIIQIEYPQITGKVSQPVAERLNENIKRDILATTFLSDQTESFLDLKTELETDYESVIEEFPDYANSWTVEITSDILYQDSLFISVASTVYSYTGGAHPNSGQVYRSYDLRTGEPIGLDDLLKEGYEKGLNEAAEIEFRMTKEIPPSQSLQDRGYSFENDRFELNKNFAIINKSLVFYFNPYEIAPYSLGPTELELRLTDYINLIKEGSVIDDYKN